MDFEFGLYAENIKYLRKRYVIIRVDIIQPTDDGSWNEILDIINTNNYDYNEDTNSKIENNKAIYVECNYHKAFKKWIPFKKVDGMDLINTINQTQIILDSL